jgi:hypothetical protein
MPEQEALRELIRRGEERLSHSRVLLARVQKAESQTARILNSSKVRATKTKGTEPRLA